MTIVYVLNKSGEPLMPTKKLGKIKRLLKSGKAVAVNNNPFTIRLKYDTKNYTQELTLGIDSGRENIGLAVSDSNNDCLYQCTVKTKNKQIKQNMADRKSFRSSRRRYKRIKKQRKAIRDNVTIQNGKDDIVRNKKSCKSVDISYPGMEESITCKVIKGKESKFNNRKIPKGWLTPSARNLVQIHTNLVKKIQEILPITNIVIEHNKFDFQKLENEDIRNWKYQQGVLYGFKDYKDYINKQQGNICLLCGKNHIEEYHHIVPQSKNGSNIVSNIAGLCKECHSLVHKDDNYSAELQSLKTGIKKKHEISLLNSCMQVIIDEITNILPTTCCTGYDTAEIRKQLNIDKTHSLDAYCISLVSKPFTIGNIYNNNYLIKHFKKKSNNNIHKLNKREYYFNNKLVAVNRHKATEQKEPSLEEYMNEYSKTHTKKETDRHFHSLTVKPAKRTYTKHKNNIVSPFKAGDKVSYKRENKVKGNTKQKVFVVESVKQEKLIYNKTKNFKIKYCKLLQSNSLEYI